MKILKINRQKWGVGDEGGSLLNKDTRKYCCLGFFAKQVGYRDNDISEIGSPSDFVTAIDEPAKRTKRIEKLKPLLTVEKNNFASDNRICKNLMSVNDSKSDHYKNPKKRESRITELFKQIGITVKFSGEYPKRMMNNYG